MKFTRIYVNWIFFLQVMPKQGLLQQETQRRPMPKLRGILQGTGRRNIVHRAAPDIHAIHS